MTLTLGWKNEKRPSGPSELDLEAGNLVVLIVTHRKLRQLPLGNQQTWINEKQYLWPNWPQTLVYHKVLDIVLTLHYTGFIPSTGSFTQNTKDKNLTESTYT